MTCRLLAALAFVAVPASAQVVTAPAPSASTLATKAEMQALQATIPTPSVSMPPAVADTGSVGTQTSFYAVANHTHASKARKARIQSAADGSLTYVFETPFGAGVVPRCSAVAETASGVTDVYNVQINGTPTNTQAVFLVNRFQRSVASLLGLTILSVPAAPGATWVHLICLEP